MGAAQSTRQYSSRGSRPSRFRAFYRSELNFLVRRINAHLIRWAMHKFKRLKGKPTRAWAWLNAVIQREPRLFAHWWLASTRNGRPVGAG